MARETRRSGAERFKYGICLNDECPKCKEKAVQKIAMRKDFVCEECGKELRECPAPPPPINWKLICGGIAIAAAAIGGGIFAFSGGETEEPQKPKTTIVQDSTETAGVDSVNIEPVKPEDPGKDVNIKDTGNQGKDETKKDTDKKKKDKEPEVSSGAVNLGYAKYTGPVKGGKPHGIGRMQFTSSHIIDSRDPKGRVAEAGDYVTGEWNEGRLVQGRWFGADGNVKSGISIGM